MIKDSEECNEPGSAAKMATDPETTRFMKFMTLIVAMMKSEEEKND